MKPYKVDNKKWSAFPESMQMKNIAAEFLRASNAGLYDDEQHREQEKGAYERALTLVDATIADEKWKDKRSLYSLRDATASLYVGDKNPAVSKFIYTKLVNNDF